MAVYAICDNNCKYETMTKEQIISLLQQLIETGSLADVDAMKDITVAAIKETHAGQDIKFWVGTEAEYNAIVPTVTAGFVMARIDENGAVYLCTDDSTMQGWHDTAVSDAAAAASAVIAEVLAKVTNAENALASHATNKSNPHGVTAVQVGALPIDGSGTMTGPIKTTSQIIELYNSYGRIVSGAGTLQLEARKNKSADDKTTLFIRSRQSSTAKEKMVQVIDSYLDSQNNAKSDYYNLYGTHSITAGTAEITAGSALATDCYYDVYE